MFRQNFGRNFTKGFLDILGLPARRSKIFFENETIRTIIMIHHMGSLSLQFQPGSCHGEYELPWLMPKVLVVILIFFFVLKIFFQIFRS